MDDLIDYVFGTGTGPPVMWSSPADADVDGDGHLDGVRLDFDGDGLVDDVLIDSDGDGVADLAALDLDDDGVPDSYFGDDGSGVWARPCAGPATPATGPPDGPPPPEPPPEPPPAGRVGVDTDGDGVDDHFLVDRNRDGVADGWE